MAKLCARGRIEVARYERDATRAWSVFRRPGRSAANGTRVTDTAAVMSDGRVLLKTTWQDTFGARKSGWFLSNLKFSKGPKLLDAAHVYLTGRGYRRI